MSIISKFWSLESYFWGEPAAEKFIVDWNVKLVAFAVAIFPFIHRKSNVGLLERRALACLSMSQYLPMSFNIGKRAIHRTFRFDHLQFQLFRCHLPLSCKRLISYPQKCSMSSLPTCTGEATSISWKWFSDAFLCFVVCCAVAYI